VVVTYLSRVAGFLVGLELLRRGGERSSGAVGAFPLTVEEDVVLLTRCGGGAVDLLECLVMVVHAGGGDEAGFDIWASCSFGWGGLVDFDRDGFRLVVWKQGMWLGRSPKKSSEPTLVRICSILCLVCFTWALCSGWTWMVGLGVMVWVARKETG
jgi:hypothetical protein